MNIVKFGETYNISEEKDTYTIKGDLIITVQGNVIINIGTTTPDGEYISSMNGDYIVNEGRLNFNFRTSIDRQYEQLEIINLVLDAIKNILNGEI